MKFFLRPLLTALACVAVAIGVTRWLVGPNPARSSTPRGHPRPSGAVVAPLPTPGTHDVPGPERAARVVGPGLPRPGRVRRLIPAATRQFTDKVRDQGSLREYREAIAHRGERARAQLRERIARLRLGPQPTLAGRCRRSRSEPQLAFVALYEGDHDEAASLAREGAGALAHAGRAGRGPGARDGPAGHQRLASGRAGQLHRLRRPVELHLPDRPRGGPHPAGGLARGGRWFTAYLDEWPGDLRVRWLLNIASMTLGEYPDKVPPRYLIPIEPFRSKQDLGRFENMATAGRPGPRGPDLAGGCIFDDFTGDGRPDLFTTSFDVVHGASLYVNRGDGRFEDRSGRPGSTTRSMR